MFNNLFDSFHDTVAEAKEEREQLNRLLMISTPWERLLVAVISLLMFMLAAWLVFGNVSRNVVVDGILVEPAEVVIAGRPVGASARLGRKRNRADNRSRDASGD